MSQATYDIKIYNAAAEEIGSLNDFTSLDCVLSENQIGAVTLRLPPRLAFDFYRKDGRIAIYRSVNGRPHSLLGNTIWLIRKRQKTITRERGREYEITALHPNCLLDRRIVAYEAGSTQTDKNAEADDLIKEVVRENLGSSATDTDRQFSSALFSVQADVTLGPIIQKAFTRRRVLDVCQEVAAAAFEAGTYVGFEIYAKSTTELELRTYVNQRGIDHGANSSQPIYLPLDEVTVTDDWTSEVTFVYAGGKGIGSDRAIGSASNSTLIGESPFGRSEHFWDGRQTDNTTILNDEADSVLRLKRPRRTITGEVQDLDGAIFGIHYDWGDIAAIDVDGDVRDVRIDIVNIKVDRENGERVTARIRSD